MAARVVVQAESLHRRFRHLPVAPGEDLKMADDAGGKGRRTFRKFSYRGVDLDQLLDMSTDELVELFPARARRRYRIYWTYM